MDDTLKGQVEQKSLISDEYYYRNIFKKTEKIVSAVFFIISKRQNIPADNVVRADLERRAKDTHSVALSVLNMEVEAAQYGMQTLLHGLVSLDSVLRVFAAMGGISEQNLQVLTTEIDGVERSMRKYLGDSFVVHDAIEQPRVVQRSVPVPTMSQPTPVTHRSSGQGESRQERILRHLRDNDGVGIKDLHAVISDCSEKTIQRELQSLIENGLVRREGERRWSRYFVA